MTQQKDTKDNFVEDVTANGEFGVSDFPLKPCPFCGSDNIDSAFWMNKKHETGPGCMDCGAQTDSVRLWNSRSDRAEKCVEALAGVEDPQAFVEAFDEMREALEESLGNQSEYFDGSDECWYCDECGKKLLDGHEKTCTVTKINEALQKAKKVRGV